MKFSQLNPVVQFLSVIAVWVVLIVTVCSWATHEMSQEAQQARFYDPVRRMNAAKKSLHEHTYQSIRLRREGKYDESEYQNKLASIAYDEWSMYFHQIQAKK
jgi:hypothetical protein